MEAAWIAFLAICLSLPLLYLLWKHHPSYGANPGAPSVPLLGSLPFVLLNRNRLHQWTCELFDRSPSLTRRLSIVSSVVLATADPAVVHHILKSRFPHYPKGPAFYPHFADLLGNGIFNCDGVLWRLQRKVASRVFTSNSLRDFVVTIADAEISKRLLPVLECAERHSDGFVDLQALLLHFTFDTICQLTFGSDPACLDASRVTHKGSNGKSPSSIDVSSDYGHASDNRALDSSESNVPHQLIRSFVQSFQIALQICAERFLVPGFLWKFKRALNIGNEKKLVEVMQTVNAFTAFVIEQSKRDLDNGKDRKDLLARFMRLSNNPDEVPENAANEDGEEGLSISDSLLKDFLLCFILAGRETVASGVTFAMWLLSTNPRVEQEVLKEINGILGKRQSDCAPQGGNVVLFTYDELRTMNYLQAVLSESMRLYPPVPFNCKFASQDDTFPDGTRVGKGDQVSYNVFAMGRAGRVWGKDCLEFCPERWLDSSGAFVPNFEFTVKPGFKPNLSYGVNLLMRHGLPITVKKRFSHQL